MKRNNTYRLGSCLWVVILLIITGKTLQAQDLSNNLKLYHTLGVSKDLGSRDNLSLSGTMLGDAITAQFEYFQFGLAYSRKVGKRSKIEAGADAIRIKEPGSAFKKYYRFSASYQFQHKWHWFQLNHAAEAEYFIPGFSKFQSRWSAESEVTTRKSWTSFKFRPFTRFKMYYYHGGNYLSYYDNDGDLQAKQSPNDVHRWRWYGGVKFRIAKSVNAKICYFWNEEFNAGLRENSDINIYNKSKTAVRMPFNSFGAISTAITIQL